MQAISAEPDKDELKLDLILALEQAHSRVTGQHVPRHLIHGTLLLLQIDLPPPFQVARDGFPSHLHPLGPENDIADENLCRWIEADPQGPWAMCATVSATLFTSVRGQELANRCRSMNTG